MQPPVAQGLQSEKRSLTTLQGRRQQSKTKRHPQLQRRRPARGRRRSALLGHSQQVRRVQAGVGMGVEVKVAQVQSRGGGGGDDEEHEYQYATDRDEPPELDDGECIVDKKVVEECLALPNWYSSKTLLSRWRCTSVKQAGTLVISSRKASQKTTHLGCMWHTSMSRSHRVDVCIFIYE